MIKFKIPVAEKLYLLLLCMPTSLSVLVTREETRDSNKGLCFILHIAVFSSPSHGYLWFISR